MKYDAIIVLGGGVNYDGSVNDISKYKVDSAAELFNSHLAPRMIMSTKCSGFLPKKPKSTESESMKRYAMQLGVPESAILKEDESLDTIGNALYTKQKYLIPNNWKKIIVVTSDFHMERTKYIFQKVMGPEYEMEFKESKSNFDENTLKERLLAEKQFLSFTEIFFMGIKDGDDQSIRSRLFLEHPFYSKSEKYRDLIKNFGKIVKKTYEFGEK